MTALWNLLRTRGSAQHTAKLDELLQRHAPGLLAVHGYPRLFLPAFETALDYARNLASQVPGVIEISEKSYGTDPLVRHLFADLDALEHTVMLSEATRECAIRHCEEGTQAYALLGVRRWRKQRFGIALSGANSDQIHRDVAQETLSFQDHTFSLPANSEQGLMDNLTHGFIASLVLSVADRWHASRDELIQLRMERDRLRDMLRRVPQPEREALQAQHDALLTDMQAQAQKLAPESALDAFNAVMQDPAKHLRLEPDEITLNDIGILCAEADGGHRLLFQDLVGRDRRRWSVMRVRFTLNHAPSMSERLAEAHRWLSV